MSNGRTPGSETLRWALTAAWYLGFIGTCPGFVSLVGYMSGLQWLAGPWMGPTPMALSTATSVSAIGVGVMILAHVSLRTLDRRFGNGSNRLTRSAGSA